jgi:prophage regulatory protein
LEVYLEITTQKSINSILRLKQVCELTGLKRSTVYNRMADGMFPKQFPLGGRAVGWLASDVDSWISHVVQTGRASGNGLVQL